MSKEDIENLFGKDENLIKFLCQYSFDSDGNLLPQIVKKRELARFYGKTPRMLRNELHIFLYPKPNVLQYSVAEVAKILQHLGRITIYDVKNAYETITDDIRRAKKNNRLKNLIK